MISLQTTPRLGSMVITKDADWKYTYYLPRGQSFPAESTGLWRVTDRAGGVVAEFEATISGNTATWHEEAGALELIEAGHNFEVFLTIPDDGTYKVLYGRVVRREPHYPLSPVSTDIFTAAMYEDVLDRDAVGPYWIAKDGRVAMHPVVNGPASYAMGVRNLNIFLPLTLWEDAAMLWYAPVRSDTVEITVGLVAGGNGDCTIVLCSNSTMTNWLGVRFHEESGSGDTIQAVVGSGPITSSAQGSTYSHSVPSGGGIYTIRYSLPLNTLSVSLPNDPTPVLEWEDESELVIHGAGHRYVGVVWNSSFASSGPLMYYWKAQDDV